MGTGRSLYQASEDGMLPRWFGKVNVHGVPARAMAFNVAASMLVVLFGSPVRIYIFSNAGYLFACAMSLARLLRLPAAAPGRPSARSACLAGSATWRLAIFLFWAVVYFYGGWNAPNIVVAPNSGPVLFILGLVIMALYFPLYYWRKRSDQRRPAPVAATVAATVGQPLRCSRKKNHDARNGPWRLRQLHTPLAAGQPAGGAPVRRSPACLDGQAVQRRGDQPGGWNWRRATASG